MTLPDPSSYRDVNADMKGVVPVLEEKEIHQYLHLHDKTMDVEKCQDLYEER